MAPVTRRRPVPALLLLAALAGCGHSTGPTDARSDRASIPAPTALTAQQNRIGAFVQWQAPDSDFVVIAGWHVYRTTPDDVTLRLTTAPVTDREFSDRDVLMTGLTEYRVTALSRGGVESLPAGPAFVFVDTLPPSRVEGLRAEALPSSIFLTWTAGPENDLAGYEVFRDGVFAVTINDPAMPAYLDFDVVPGHEYAYHVLAVDFQEHRSAPSDTVRVRIGGTRAE